MWMQKLQMQRAEPLAKCELAQSTEFGIMQMNPVAYDPVQPSLVYLDLLNLNK